MFARLSASVAFAIVLIGLSPVRGQSTYDLFGSARADALGRATTAAPRSSGPTANPAAGAARAVPSVRFYARQSFGLAALRYGAVGGTLPRSWGTLLGGASTFGTDAYREVHFSAGYARALQLGTTRRLYVGLTLRYYHTRIAGYGSAGALGLNPGILVQVLPSLHFGAHAVNVNGAALTDGEPLPRTLAVGLQYTPLPDMRILADVFKDVGFPATVRGGIEVRPVEVLALRAGLTTAPTRFTGGVGVHLGPLRAGVALEQHQQLGWSPSVAFEVHW